MFDARFASEFLGLVVLLALKLAQHAQHPPNDMHILAAFAMWLEVLHDRHEPHGILSLEAIQLA